MRRDEVQIGATYRHKGRKVRIDRDLGSKTSWTRNWATSDLKRYREVHAGWEGTNISTGRKIHVKSAKGLTPYIERRPKTGTALDLNPVELSMAIETAQEEGDLQKVEELADLQARLRLLVAFARNDQPHTDPLADTAKRKQVAHDVVQAVKKFQNDVAGLENVLHNPISTIEVR